ncbi:MAG TPA: NUDIX domain-containing protein [Acidimicrobiales bacterium]
MAAHQTFAAALAAYRPGSPEEAADLERAHVLLAGPDPWSRSVPLHVTGSALVVHPPTSRVLLRWHQRQQAWLQVGGHADPGEVDPFVTAVREGGEETGLADLRPWPGPEPTLVHLVTVPVPAGKGEPAHEHLDVRYVLATDTPDAVEPENPTARLRWLPVTEAMTFVAEENLRVMLRRVADLLVDVRGSA